MAQQFQQAKPVQHGDTTRIFVSLYLILLAFFVVMNVISNQVSSRTSAALESVSSTFKKPFPDFSDQIDLDAAGKTGSHNDFVSSLKGLFTAEIEIKGRFSAQGGNVVSFEVPVEMFFASDNVRVRANKNVLLDDIATLVTSAPKGYRREVAFMFGSGRNTVDPGFLRGQVLSNRRAGALARLLTLRGFPDGTFATGFIPADRKNIIVLFRTVPEVKARITLSHNGHLITNNRGAG